MIAIELRPEPMTPAAERGLRIGLAAIGIAAAYNTDANVRALVWGLAGIGFRPEFGIAPIDIAIAGPASHQEPAK